MKMPFGKHRGVPLSQIEDGYLTWVLDTCTDISPTLRKRIVAELDRREGVGADLDGAMLAIGSVANRWYRRLSMEFHTDRGGSHQAMVAINRARELLLEMAGAT